LQEKIVSWYGFLHDQRIELLGSSSRDAIRFHLPFSDHVHGFDSGQDDAGAAKVTFKEKADSSWK
jgi:hypothetical protein